MRDEAYVFDIGGTTVTCALVENWEVRDKTQVSSKEYSSPEQLFENLIEHSFVTTQFPWILGVPGPVEGDNRVGSMPNLGGWTGSTLRDYLKEKHVRYWLVNDATLNALGEAQARNLKTGKKLLCLTLGTGIGSGWGTAQSEGSFRPVLDRSPEVGHLVIEPGGRCCRCGKAGCWERYGSARGLEITFWKLSGKQRQAHDIMQGRLSLYEREAIRQTGLCLGRGLAKIVDLIGPDIVVFSGGMARSFSRLEPHVKNAFQRDLFVTSRSKCSIEKSMTNLPAMMGGWMYYHCGQAT
ncbi:MAG: ROK family protein [bacterium]